MKLKVYGLLLLAAAVLVSLFLFFRYRPATPDQVGEEGPPAKITLAEIKAEMTKTAAALNRGRGEVTVNTMLDRDGGISESESRSQVVFAGEKFKIIRTSKNIRNETDESASLNGRRYPAGKIRETLVYDGKKAMVYHQNEGRATICLRENEEGRNAGCAFDTVRPVWQGFLNIDRYLEELPPEFHQKALASPTIKQVTLNGEKALLLEASFIYESGKIKGAKEYDQYWLLPEKGFAVARLRRLFQPKDSNQKRLSAEAKIAWRQDKQGNWRPERTEGTVYHYDESGQQSIDNREIITYDRNFQADIPISNKEFTLTLPSGTKVQDEVLGKDYTVP